MLLRRGFIWGLICLWGIRGGMLGRYPPPDDITTFGGNGGYIGRTIFHICALFCFFFASVPSCRCAPFFVGTRRSEENEKIIANLKNRATSTNERFTDGYVNDKLSSTYGQRALCAQRKFASSLKNGGSLSQTSVLRTASAPS